MTGDPRPKSNWAQILQACLTACQVTLGFLILGFAYYTYEQTVLPVQKLVEVEERRILAERALAGANRAIAEAEQHVAQYQTRVRRFVIEQFIARVFSDAAALGVAKAGYVEATVFEDLFVQPRSRIRALYGAATGVTLHSLMVPTVDVDFSPHGRRIVELARHEMTLLTREDDRIIKAEIDEFMRLYPNPGLWEASLLAPDTEDEQERHYSLHREFVIAILDLREMLLAKYVK